MKISLTLPLPPNFVSRDMLKMKQNDPHGTLFGMGTKKILLPDTLQIAKMQVKKMYHVGAWEPYLPTRLISLL